VAGEDGVVVRRTDYTPEYLGPVKSLDQPEQPTDAERTKRDSEAIPN
jgi:hypothetical protein